MLLTQNLKVQKVKEKVFLKKRTATVIINQNQRPENKSVPENKKTNYKIFLVQSLKLQNVLMSG